ncbi:MAG: carbohydrate binding domain-containing protein, partial [Flavobacteriales bacterium]
MRTAVFLSTLVIAGMSSAQVFTNGFEDWTGTVPNGWEGSKTNLALSQVTQVTDNPHGGSYALRLVNQETSHKRFSTTDVTVISGTTYEVSYWARGTGEIRSGLFDGRPTNSGYSDYSDFATISSSDVWVYVTQDVAAAYDTTGGEFILSMRNTTDPENLVIDDVNITAVGAEVSIYDIQYTNDASGDSPYAGQTVNTGGIVTAIIPTVGFFIQSGSGHWTGVYVSDADDAVAMGDSLTLTATVSENSSNTELSGVSGLIVVSSGNTMPAAADVLSGEVAHEQFESVLVRIVGTPCTEAPSGANLGKYKLDDGSGFAVIDKMIYITSPAPSVGDVLTVTGVDYFASNEFDIEP